jgi:hypothetical protein
MTNRGRVLAKLTLALVGCVGLGIATPLDAEACGGFFRARRTVTVPSLEVEQVLLVHDPATEEEQFIREIVFRDAKEPFGFVVPVPSQPTVSKVDKSPFAALAARFPPEPPDPPSSGGGGKGGGLRGLGGGSGSGAGVAVLSQERIGSFTAFVLAATDAKALKKWLDDNELVTTPESEAWLKHYVDLGFYFTAFRYEVPTTKATGTSKSETVRLTFKTPLPYYPYREPDHATPPAKKPRVLAVWVVSPERSVPLAAVTEEGAIAWKRPWAEAMKHAPQSTSILGSIIGATNLGSLSAGQTPDRPLVVQTFEDQKTSRRGWGDVVLVPAAPHENDAARLERMTKLMASLDPALGGAK